MDSLLSAVADAYEASDSAINFFFSQIYHVENKCTPFTLLSVVNAWKTDGPETVTNSDAKSNGTSSVGSFIAEISEGVSGELHHGILKAARRVVFDEIISNVINEFFTTKKAQRLNQTVKTCSSDSKTVMITTPRVDY